MRKFTDWLQNESQDCGLCDPPLDPQLALDFIGDYLLGENWGMAVGVSQSRKQMNSALVHMILNKYSFEYRREVKEMNKKPSLKERIISMINAFNAPPPSGRDYVSLDSSITESLRDSINSSESVSDSPANITGYQPKKSSEEIPPPPDISTTVQSPPRRVKIAFKTAKIDNRGKSGKWLINCDGYYPYCSLCGYEPEWTGKDNRTSTCPRCKATLERDDFDEKNYTTIRTKNFPTEWKVISDNQSTRYICPNCKFEHVEADPCAQIEWEGCPNCLTRLKVPSVRTRLLSNIYDK